MHTVSDILQAWIDGINTADIKKLINLYDENAVLIPTFSNRILDTKEKIKDYFDKILVITHNSLVKEWCDNNITIKKVNNVLQQYRLYS